MVWDVDPELFSVGSIGVRWYTTLLMVGSFFSFLYMIRVFRREDYGQIYGERILDIGLDLYARMAAGALVGARLAHCLIYEPDVYLAAPWKILMVWEGGLASHGGYVGVAVGAYSFARKYGQRSFLWLVDRVAPCTLLIGGFVRIGNFFNSEIIGRPSDLPWAVVFRRIDEIPRHPAMLYEAAAYLLIALVCFGAIERFRKTWKDGSFLGLTLALGMSVRVLMEFFKESQVGFEQGMLLNMGQLLSLPFAIFGVYLLLGRHADSRFFAPVMRPFDERKRDRQGVGAAPPKKKTSKRSRKKNRK